MKSAPHVGISTVWWEGNPCKYVLSLRSTLYHKDDNEIADMVA